MTAIKRARHVLPAVLALAVACTGIYWPYDDVEETPVRSIDRPDNYIRGGFGKIVVGVHRPEHGGEPEARYVALSGGGDTPTSIYRLSLGVEIGGGLAYSYASAIRSDPFSLYFTGAALASIPEWEYVDTDRGCVIIGEPGYEGSIGGFSRYCMDSSDSENPRRIEGTNLSSPTVGMPTGAGRSLAVLASPATASDAIPDSLRYVVVGAEGTAHLMGNMLSPTNTPGVEPPTGLETVDFGVAVAAGHTGTSWPAWLAVGSEGRVYVYGVWDDPATTGAGEDPDHLWLQACYESTGREGFGTLLWSADVDGDGRTELAVGSHPDTEGRTEDVVVVDGTTFHDGAVPDPYPTVTCTPVPEDAVFTCQDFPDRGIACGDQPDFGASFAVGDLDDDGASEVVIGAPGALAGGKRAGAVLIYHPSDPAVPVSALRDAYPERNQKLGWAVTVSEIAGMDEVIAGAPGSKEVFVFYCSGVGQDDPDFHGGKVCR